MNPIKYHVPMFWLMPAVKAKRTRESGNVDNDIHSKYQRVFTKQNKLLKKGSDNNFISSAPNHCCPFFLDLCFFPLHNTHAGKEHRNTMRLLSCVDTPAHTLTNTHTTMHYSLKKLLITLIISKRIILWNSSGLFCQNCMW